jgi:hypothetical protein
MAVIPPDWVTRVPEVTSRLRERVKAAREANVFNFATTVCEKVPSLYIRPRGLYEEVVHRLTPPDGVPPSGSARGVLIWGGRGMGKTSLARDVAHAFAFDSGGALPEGAWRCPCVLASVRICWPDPRQGLRGFGLGFT